MARKAKYDWGKSSGKYQKFETRLALKAAALSNTQSPYSDSVYIDVAQCLSIVNRKLVRQGQVFKIKNFRAYTNDDDNVAMLKVGVLPRSWCMFNAYKKARGLWNAHNLDALADLGSGNLPAYYDFKVFMDPNHVTNHLKPADVNLLPVDFEDNAAATGEWLYSQFADSGTTANEHYCHMLGGHMSDVDTEQTNDTLSTTFSVGAILAYQQSRGFRFSGADVTGSEQQAAADLRSGPWGRLRGDDNQRVQVIGNLEDNDDPPYHREQYPGSRESLSAPNTVYYGRLTQLVHGGTNTATAVPQFEAPLGLIRIEADAESADPGVQGLHVHFDTEIMGAC